MGKTLSLSLTFTLALSLALTLNRYQVTGEPLAREHRAPIPTEQGRDIRAV